MRPPTHRVIRRYQPSDCAAGGDTCVITNNECFTDNGVVGSTVSVGGAASTSAPTLGAIGCMAPSSSNIINSGVGLPGLARLTLPGTAVIQ